MLGISKDSVSAQAKFRAKHDLPFSLLSDPDATVCNLYGVIQEKSMYGKIMKGIERSTFVIDATGRVKKIFRKVKVDGHARAVLAEI